MINAPARPGPYRTYTIRGREIDLSRRTGIMGVVNVTPDSFSDGGAFLDPEEAVAHALRLVDEGADIVDVGGESSRPGAPAVPEAEELARIVPVVTGIRRRSNIPLSIDTWKANVARAALEAGADIINDITALRGDSAMAGIAAQHRAPVILMHMRGDPRTMQQDTVYDDLCAEIEQYLRHSIAIAERAGVARDTLIIDPGIGFGKSVDQNLLLLKELRYFTRLGLPIMVGVSRKSFIGAALGRNVEDRQWGTAASIVAAILNGASLVRVHDVRIMAEVCRMADAIQRGAADAVR